MEENTLIKIFQKLGNLETGIEDLKNRFDNLPCPQNTKLIQEHESFKNKAVGMAALMGVVFGFVGWILTPIINWLLDKMKF